jgi:putative ABC transport system ATP-binding protein
VQPTAAGDTIIRLRNLVRYYRMGQSIVKALDGVDLDIRRGQFVAITGPSGSGKSTMMHIFGCLDRPNSGTFELNGELVSTLSDRKLAVVRNRHIGFVFQTFNLINRTNALDNVAVPLIYARKTNTHRAARAALERVGLGNRARHRSSELSGGERQRVAIARAIVNDPLLLLADEPTGNLDTATGEQIMSIFHELHRGGVTVVVVTHEPDIAVQAERVVRMRDGKIVEDRPVDPKEREAYRPAAERPA